MFVLYIPQKVDEWHGYKHQGIRLGRLLLQIVHLNTMLRSDKHCEQMGGCWLEILRK